MSFLGFLSHPGWHQVVMTLLHTLWQAPLIAACIYLLLRSTPAGSANTRYAFASAGLAGVMLAALMTWAVLDWQGERASVSAASATLTPAAPVSATPGVVQSTWAPPSQAMTRRHEVNLNWSAAIGGLWMCGVMLMLVRVGLQFAGARQLQSSGRTITEGDLPRLVEELRGRMGIGRKVRLRRVERLVSPAVAGLWWPTVLIPASLLTDLPAAALLPILAHELAHVRRYDALVNLAQLLIEAVLFFNPAVWWISRQMRIEREACCDAMAASLTGEPSRYARSLVEWAEHAALSSLGGRMPAMGFAEDGRGTLLDRAQRLLLPHHRPELKVSWPTLLVAVVLSTGLLAGLLEGTRGAVALAAKVLSSEERMQHLADAQAEYAPLSTQPTGEGVEKALIEGTIRSEDGRPLDGRVDMISHSDSPGHTVQTSHRVRPPQYSISVRPGSLLLQVTAPGYAPTNVGPIRARPGETVSGVDITLKEGCTAGLELLDEAGKPVADATVEGGMQISGGHSWYAMPSSDASGRVEIAHAGEGTYSLRVTADGFEPAQRELKFKPDRTVQWTLKRARPTNGVLLDPDGKPVADAALRLLGRVVNGRAEDIMWSSGDVLATTDEQGRFTLDRLRSDAEHVLLVETPDAGQRLVRGIRAGQENLAIRLDPEIVIRGKVIGNLGTLEEKDGTPLLSYSNALRIADHSSGGQQKTVPVRAGEGGGEFEIRGILPGTLDLTAGTRTITVEAERSRDDVVINLDGASFAKRLVLFKFKMPPGTPPPTGLISAYSSPADGRQAPPAYAELEIVEGQAEFDAYVGGRLSYQPKRLVGASFEERALEKLPPGEEPLVIEIPANPAGAIVGRIEADPMPDGHRSSISVSVLSAPESDRSSGPRFRLHNIDVEAGTGHYMATPLPLGATYIVNANRGKNIVFSEPVRVDEKSPLPRVDLQLKPGKTIEVVVRYPEGRPAAGIPVAFSYDSLVTGSGGYSPDPLTDEQGRVRFEDVNPDPRIKYSVRLPVARDYRPTGRVAVMPGGEATVIQLERGLMLHGRVTEANSDRPLADCEVRAFRVGGTSLVWEDAYPAESRTDGQGTFRFSNLAPGAYHLSATPKVRGSARFEHPDSMRQFTAGQAGPAEIRVGVQELSSPPG